MSSIAIAKQLGEFEAALLSDVLGGDQAMQPDIRPLWTPIRLWGIAFPVVLAPDDNLEIHYALKNAPGGSVVVAVANSSAHPCGIWGEIASCAAQVRGIQGFVTDGYVRDRSAIRDMQFPVFCRGVSMRRAAKVTRGLSNAPIQCGSINVFPGDYIVGDDDGVVVIPQAEAERVLAKVAERRQQEQAFLDRIRAGESTLKILGLGED